MKQFSGFFLFVLMYNIPAAAQLGYNDTNYYKTYPGSITARFYLSQKYTAFAVHDKKAEDLAYQPNTTLNMGLGATYHNFSLNIAYGFGFLNQDKAKGKTKYLDLQGHAYRPKWVIDYYGQLYKGYYLRPKGFAATNPGSYYYLADAKVNLFGLSAYHMFNSRRFSYRAAIIQNEWQKKSAGTFLAGAEAYYGIVRSDSSWVPAAMAATHAAKGITNINFFSIGPGAGYAHTLVAFEHVFVSGSLTGSLHASYVTEKGTATHHKFALTPVARFRVAAGYNGDVWNVSANCVADQLLFKGYASGSNYLLQTGNYRFNIAKRLMPGPKLKRHLRIADKLFKE